ncbi:hypothetical protein BN946_scf184823.g17 [Trametes cinnabarina]|uniref:SUI1 domain-containing protein n=1 Tax=Pycnoporus cinnabarinus TaxID=5643 RepID=A0A060SSN4_PYCCI|nr:hypothetical protein BN946_scf184823.g17 [Trametes cinnabarina]
MAVSSDTLHSAGETDIKGKAVYVLHTWKDALWEMGPSKKADLPAPKEPGNLVAGEDPDLSDTEKHAEGGNEPSSPQAGVGTRGIQEPPGESDDPAVQPPDDEGRSSPAKLIPEDVSSLLRAALIHAIGTTLAKLTPSSFPISASTFWSAYVLPARPAYALEMYGLPDASSIDVKHSTFKNVKTFLKASAKDGLIKLKESKSDVMVTAIFPQHPDVLSQRPHRTIGDIETKAKKAEDRQQKEREAEEKRKGEIQVSELWKPFGTTVPLFVAAGKDASELYTAYINVGSDQELATAVSLKGEDTADFMKRDEVLKRVRAHMQTWHEIRAEGRDVVRKRGELKPISVVVKIRQGRKACTLLTGFEPYGLQAEELAEELRKVCASSTSGEFALRLDEPA